MVERNKVGMGVAVLETEQEKHMQNMSVDHGGQEQIGRDGSKSGNRTIKTQAEREECMPPAREA